MTILYFGTYDPQYSRNRVLIRGLKASGVRVIECNSRARSFLKYIVLVFQYLKNREKYDVMMVGFPGQEMMFLAKLLSSKPVIFDVFTSHFGGHILDRGKHDRNSWRAKWYRWLDRKSVALSDMALLDTDAHIDFFVSELGLPKEKFKRIFVGTDSAVFYPREIKKKETNEFLVHFHGRYIPLQGVEHIIRAAKLLEKENIVFNLIGRGQTYQKIRALAESLEVKNINFIDKVSYEQLADYLNMADISLGIFGETLKAELVIPNKIFEAIACAKPVVTAKTRGAEELFTDRQNILFCRQADSEDLAEKIRILKQDESLRRQVAEGGFNLYKNNLQGKDLVRPIIDFIHECKLLSK